MSRFMICFMFLLASQLVAASSQMLLKKSAGIQYSSKIREYLNFFVICGYAMLFVSMLLTTLGYRFSDSYMNVPVLESMGYIFVLLFSRLFFGEKFTRRKLLGVTLIFAGILIYNL